MVEAGLIIARLLHIGSLMLLFGASLFPVYAYSKERPIPFFEACWISTLLLISCLVALVSGVLWLALTAASLTDSLGSAINPDMLSLILGRTEFGGVWAMRLCLMVVMSAALMVWVDTPVVDRRDFQMAQAAASALLLATLALVGHAQASPGMLGVVHQFADMGHLLAAGAWFGGLAPLGLALRLLDHDEATNSFDLRNAGRALSRFSTLTLAALGAVVATGLVNSFALVGSLEGLVETEYGHWLLAKVVVVAVLVALIWTGRERITRRLASDDKKAVHLLKDVQRRIVIEQAGGAIVATLVAVMGMLTPASF
jgi:putative copper resistance protein D